jgi:hypothetical protein
MFRPLRAGPDGGKGAATGRQHTAPWDANRPPESGDKATPVSSHFYHLFGMYDRLTSR